MTRDEIIDNLGTIARSGSQAFLDKIKDKDTSMNESIIGQFGVGFYSSFIVSDSVEVYSKAEGENGVRWVSDGSVRIMYFRYIFRVITKYQMHKT